MDELIKQLMDQSLASARRFGVFFTFFGSVRERKKKTEQKDGGKRHVFFLFSGLPKVPMRRAF